MAEIRSVYTPSMVIDVSKSSDTPIIVLYTELPDLFWLLHTVQASYFYSGMHLEEYEKLLRGWYSRQVPVLLVHAQKYWQFESPFGDGTEPTVLWYKPNTNSSLYKEIING